MLSSICRHALAKAASLVSESSYFHPTSKLSGKRPRSRDITFVAGFKTRLRQPDRLAIFADLQSLPCSFSIFLTW